MMPQQMAPEIMNNGANQAQEINSRKQKFMMQQN
jgi:hypothetical protein